VADVRRRLRLAAPAIAFGAVGAILLLFGPDPEMRLKGGFATSGAYVLALQLVLASFLLAVIDDLREPLPREERPVHGHFLTSGEVVPEDIRRALLQFYLSSPLAALLLAFGLASSLGVLLSGLLDGAAYAPRLIDSGLPRSAVAMGALLLLTSLAQLPAPRAGFLGWCVGFTAGSALARIQFVAGVDIDRTWQISLIAVVALIALWGVAHIVTAVRVARPDLHDRVGG
jgi:hypothetical protein